MAVLAVQFPHFLKLFVFCQSGAHFASPWQTQVYFLLGLNTCRSQMKATAPRESSGSHQLVDEVVLCSSGQILKGLCALNWRSKSAEEGKWRKELKVHLTEEYFLTLLSALLPQAELGVSTSCVHLTSYCVGMVLTRYLSLPLSNMGSLRQGQRSVHLHIAGMQHGVWQWGQEKFIFSLLCVRHCTSAQGYNGAAYFYTLRNLESNQDMDA